MKRLKGKKGNNSAIIAGVLLFFVVFALIFLAAKNKGERKDAQDAFDADLYKMASSANADALLAKSTAEFAMQKASSNEGLINSKPSREEVAAYVDARIAQLREEINSPSNPGEVGRASAYCVASPGSDGMIVLQCKKFP